VADHCLRSEDYVNVIVADKQPHPAYLDMMRRSSIARRASVSGSGEQRRRCRAGPVIASAGDILTTEALAASSFSASTFQSEDPLRQCGRSVSPAPDTEHPHGLSARDFDSLFTRDKPVILQLPWLPLADPQIHVPPNEPRQHHVRGYKERAISTHPELLIHNQVDRFDLAIDAIDRVPKLQGPGAHLKEWLKGQIIERSITPIPRSRQTRDPELEVASRQRVSCRMLRSLRLNSWRGSAPSRHVSCPHRFARSLSQCSSCR